MCSFKTDVYPLTYLPAEIVWGDVAKVACTALLMSLWQRYIRVLKPPAFNRRKRYAMSSA